MITTGSPARPPKAALGEGASGRLGRPRGLRYVRGCSSECRRRRLGSVRLCLQLGPHALAAFSPDAAAGGGHASEPATRESTTGQHALKLRRLARRPLDERTTLQAPDREQPATMDSTAANRWPTAGPIDPPEVDADDPTLSTTPSPETPGGAASRDAVS